MLLRFGAMSSDETLEGLRLTTVLVAVTDGVATITLDRPSVHNAFDALMVEELARVWQTAALDDAVRALVLTGRGAEAFCTGLDRSTIPEGYQFDPFSYRDPGRLIGPKSQGLWKPVIAAVNG